MSAQIKKQTDKLHNHNAQHYYDKRIYKIRRKYPKPRHQWNNYDQLKKDVNPSEILLVIDSMMGQDAINVITGFNDALKLTGVILTKLDGDTRGGVALSVRHLTNIPIKFIGVSEKMDGLSEFHPDRMANRIIGMGDVLSLVEKVESEIDEKEAGGAADKIKTAVFYAGIFIVLTVVVVLFVKRRTK